ncbi:MAG: hypothetical protein AAFY03_05750, partial [Pseudomonadota bacterium]
NNWTRTIIDILNLQPGDIANSNIVLDGRIDNPIGITTIRNERGNIRSATDADIELIRTTEIDIDAIGGSIGVVGDSGGEVGSNNRTPLYVELVRWRDAGEVLVTPSVAPNSVVNPDIEANATRDVVLDLFYFDRANNSFGGNFSQTADIREIIAGDDVSLVINDMREGVEEIDPGAITVADRGSTVDLREVENHFRPDVVPGPDYENLLRAFGTDFRVIDSLWDFAEVRAGDDIDIGHITTTAVFGEPRTYATRSIGGDPYGASVTLAAPQTTVDFLINTDVDWTGGTSNDASEQIFLTTNGDITATELVGDMQVGHIHSTAGDVTLNAPEQITDANSAATIDVTAENITMTTGLGESIGGIGARDDFLEINVNRNTDPEFDVVGVLNAFDNLAVEQSGIYIDELIGDLHVDQVWTDEADVSLRSDGGILDARADRLVNVLGQAIDLDGNGGVVGEVSNALEIDSSRGLTNLFLLPGGSDVSIEACEGIHVVEMEGFLRMAFAHAYDGDILIRVTDSAVQGEDFVLVNSGSARFAESNNRAPTFHIDADRIFPNGMIFAESGNATIIGADNMLFGQNTRTVASENVLIRSDVTPIDPGFGAIIQIMGDVIAGADVIRPGDKFEGGNPLGTLRPTYTRPVFTAEVQTGEDADTVIFGDPSGDVGGTRLGSDGYIFLGSKTNVSTGGNEDLVQVYYLQDTATVTSPSQLDILRELGRQDALHTLTIDGNAATDTFEVFTMGSNGVDERNYIINLLDTGAPNDGVDEAFIYGFESTTDRINPGDDEVEDGEEFEGEPFSTDDIFLLRAAAFLPGEEANRPGYVALVHGDAE